MGFDDFNRRVKAGETPAPRSFTVGPWANPNILVGPKAIGEFIGVSETTTKTMIEHGQLPVTRIERGSRGSWVTHKATLLLHMLNTTQALEMSRKYHPLLDREMLDHIAAKIRSYG